MPPVPDATPTAVVTTRGVAPLLMFTGRAEEAMRAYASIFAGARIEALERYEPDEGGATGATVKHAVLRIGDHTIHCIDSPIEHAFGFTPAVSLVAECATAGDVDRVFVRLADGGTVLMPLDAYPFSERFA